MWSLFNATRSREESVCTPRVIRLTPTLLRVVKKDLSSELGLHSTVISAFEARRDSECSQFRIREKNSGDASDGVPPPKYTEDSWNGNVSADVSVVLSSLRMALLNRACGMSLAVDTLKLQYEHRVLLGYY